MELKSPEEIVRCLRLCKSDGPCEDYDGKPCSYDNQGDDIFSSSCQYRLLSDAADALSAMIYNKKG